MEVGEEKQEEEQEEFDSSWVVMSRPQEQEWLVSN